MQAPAEQGERPVATTEARQSDAFSNTFKASPSPQAMNAIEATASWKTYAYDNLFSLKYPPTWTFKEWKGTTDNGNGLIYDSEFVDFQEPDTEASQLGRIAGWFRVSITSDASLNEVTAEDFMNLAPSLERFNPQWKETTIGGMTAWAVKHSKCLSGDCIDVLIKDGRTFIVLSIPEEASKEERRAVLDLMLTTFSLRQVQTSSF